MPEVIIQLACNICGNRFEGSDEEIVAGVAECESLGEPPFEFEIGDVVNSGPFHHEVVGRKYRRRGNVHTKVYRLRIIKVIRPEGWLDGVGPVGELDWSSERNLTYVRRK